MSGANQFGTHFRVTTFGESHGAALGCVIDGCPAGVKVDLEQIQNALDRRRPGQAPWVSARKENDRVEILSGVHEGKTLGTPIAAVVRNEDARSEDYKKIEEKLTAGEVARLGHADDLWRKKFGHSDVRGGGRASGRETLARVIAGAIAKQAAVQMSGDLKVIGFASQIGPHRLSVAEREAFLRLAEIKNSSSADEFAARFPSPSQTETVEGLLTQAVQEGRSYGGQAEIVIVGAPAGLGQPVFHKLKAELASAYFGVGATAAVEIGEGFLAAGAEGTDFHSPSADSAVARDPYGGIRGGLATGAPIFARIGFKPTSTVMDLAKKGRHDPCIIPRAIPVLEAMTWLVLVDQLLWMRLDRI